MLKTKQVSPKFVSLGSKGGVFVNSCFGNILSFFQMFGFRLLTSNFDFLCHLNDRTTNDCVTLMSTILVKG
jgi:hypothetical protein